MATNIQTIAKTLLGADAIKGIGKTTGLDGEDIANILSNALPQLLSGASKQSTSKKTAASFAEALESHAGSKTSNLASFFKNVDIEDGAKIVGHLLGKGTDTTAKKISKSLGIDAADVIKVLAAAAPLLMSLMGQKTQSQLLVYTL